MPPVDVLFQLPRHRDLYYAGAWQKPNGGYLETINPGTGESLGVCAECSTADINAAVNAAHQAFASWSRTKPADRATMLRKVALILRDNATELAMLNAINCGNPVAEMTRDVLNAIAQFDFLPDWSQNSRAAPCPWATAWSTCRFANPSVLLAASSPTTTR